MTSGRRKQPYPIPEKERQLVKDCLKGDRRAQHQLFHQYKDAMYTIAHRMAGDEVLAADILQEAFIGIFNGLKHFEHRSTLGAWIKTIVVRTAYKKLKKEHPMTPIEDYHTKDMIDWGDALELEYLEKAIQSLPNGYRSVFVLIEIEGYAHKEVAELLGISPGTSKSQLFYAKRLLRKKLDQMQYVS